jgi:ribulose-5-phosphate 4-epimerase/fuculose-1-phosphate aldolase
VDAYGHISVRHPDNPDVYIISGSLAPALVESSTDFIHYHVADSTPINPEAKQGYQERHIHGEIYKRFPSVMSVIHSHSEAVLPYTMNRVSMLPAFHMAGFLGIAPHLD